jgi:hypothetical protein
VTVATVVTVATMATVVTMTVVEVVVRVYQPALLRRVGGGTEPQCT